MTAPDPRTVLLATPYFPPDLGGVQRYVWNLGRLLATRHGYRVVVATTAGRDHRPGRHEGPDGLTVYRVPSAGRISHTPLGLGWRRALGRIIEAEGVGLVNAHAPVPLFADAAARACGDLPFVLTYHTGRMRKGSPLPDLTCAAYERTVLAATARRAREVVCSSDHVAADLLHVLGGRTTTISPGADLDCFTPSEPPAQPRIVFAASLERSASYKGLDDLLHAVAALARTIPGVHLEVAGTGSSAGEYAALAQRLGIARRVTFTGHLEGAELAAAYRRARVLALPTRFDSFPSVLVEAMASGRPVVTTRVGGIPSLVADGHNGLLVEPADPGALARALGTVLTDDALARRLGAAAREHVVRHLSWERQAERTAEVFDRAARPGPAARTVAVVAPYYPPKIGGVENYAARVARAVADRPGWRAVVITTNRESRRTSTDTDGDVPVIRLGTWARLSNTPVSPLWPLQVRRWLRRLDVDVVNAHAPVPGLADVAVAVAGRRPAVLTYHSGSMLKGHRHLDRLIGGYERHVLPRVFSRARALVPVSPVSLASGWPHSTQITPGVDMDQFTAGPPPSSRERTVLYLGRIDRSSAWKGVDVLVRAFAGLGDPHQARLRLVGGGDAVEDHRALAAGLGIGERVEFAGELTGAELAAAVRSAAVLVLPSLSEAECHPMALIEAMACGTPVVGSDIGGIPHIIRHDVSGLLVPPGDPAALAAACRRVLADGALADRLGAAGRRQAEERYAWPRLTDRYLELFRSLGRLSEPRSPGRAR